MDELIENINSLEEKLINMLQPASLVSPTTIAGTLIAACLAVHYYYKNKYSYWSRRNVPGPRPSWPLVGNMLDILFKNRPLLLKGWREQYGKVFGIYEGSKPVLAVGDVDLLQRIGIKDFDVFVNHTPNELLGELQRKFVFLLNDDEWRRVRAILSPTFSSGKMRRMFKLMEVCADDLEKLFEEQMEQNTKEGELGPVINVKDLFGLYTLDAIASCCYGLKLSRANTTAAATADNAGADGRIAANRNEFMAQGLKLFDIRLWRVMLTLSLNTRLCKLLGLQMIPEHYIKPFATRVEQYIKKRESQPDKKFDDYLQILLDTKKIDSTFKDSDTTRQDNESHLDSLEQHHAPTGSDQVLHKANSNRTLDDMTILSSATFLLTVGLETTGTLLAHVAYSLAFHQDVQEKLYEVVREIAKPYEAGSSYTFDYDQLISCNYLDSVLCETLRTLPPAQQSDRVANSDYLLEKYNILVPKGTKVVLLFQEVMNDPDYWREPEKFQPDRFMPDQRHLIVPGAYCPFGIGPRHCLGMRFSLTEAKFGLAKLVMKFRFEPAPDTKYPPMLRGGLGLGLISTPIVRLLRRAERQN